MNRTFKLSLYCAGIFLAGAVSGGFAVKHFARPPQRPDSIGPSQMRRLAEGLALSEAQREAIRPVIQKASEELRALRRDGVTRATQVIEAMEAAVALQLTPEQREQLAKLQAEHRARMKAAMEERQRRMGENGERERDGQRPGERRREGDEPRRLPPPSPGVPPPADGAP